MKQYDYLIVGAGLFGATFAYLAKQDGKRCLVIDKRPNVGGNVYCENISGINVHKYGAHIFHTNNKEVWDFVNRFVKFNRYINCPLANYHGELYNLPFNMNTFHQMWGVKTPKEAAEIIEAQRADAVYSLRGKEPSNLMEQALCIVGEDIYKRLIKDYTEKQWGRECEELPPFIIKRLPVRYTFDNNYFTDKFQGVPIGGYNVLIEKLLEGIDVRVNCDFFREYKTGWLNIANELVYTGALDEYFDYQFGCLDWRSVEFKHITLPVPNYQGNAVVNYTSHEKPFTRVIEHKHFECFGDDVYNNNETVISEEYSSEYVRGGERFYPINDCKNNELADKYRKFAQHQYRVHFGGRLGEYKYYDMDKTIERAFELYRKLNKYGKRN